MLPVRLMIKLVFGNMSMETASQPDTKEENQKDVIPSMRFLPLAVGCLHYRVKTWTGKRRWRNSAVYMQVSAFLHRGMDLPVLRIQKLIGFCFNFHNLYSFKLVSCARICCAVSEAFHDLLDLLLCWNHPVSCSSVLSSSKCNIEAK